MWNQNKVCFEYESGIFKVVDNVVDRALARADLGWRRRGAAGLA